MYNGEGYSDPTAGQAIYNIDKKQNAELKKTLNLINMLIDLLGFEAITTITLRKKKSL